MLWLVSSEYWLTLRKRLCSTRVEGPEREREVYLNTKPHVFLLTNPSLALVFNPVFLTELCWGLHYAPGLITPLTNDDVQCVRSQAVLQHVTHGGTQVLQDQVSHVGTHWAVAQLCLNTQCFTWNIRSWTLTSSWYSSQDTKYILCVCSACYVLAFITVIPFISDHTGHSIGQRNQSSWMCYFTV